MFQRSVEQDLLPYCAENDISFIPYGPLAYGLLGGGWTKDYQPETAWRKKQDLFQLEYLKTI
jgi:aryl-alcohol dehydrogenase-like predicted oxidoreductase